MGREGRDSRRSGADTGCREAKRRRERKREEGMAVSNSGGHL